MKPFQAKWREHFYRINAEWLERNWTIEDIDHRVLSQPEKLVLEPGGAIFFALVDGEVIGTCALLQESPGVFELTKMGVETGWRGIGAGRLLVDAIIQEFHKRRGKTLFLESNKRLGPALKLYESAGFVHQAAPRPGSHYQRSDVYMIYEPKGSERRDECERRADKRRCRAATSRSRSALARRLGCSVRAEDHDRLARHRNHALFFELLEHASDHLARAADDAADFLA